MQLMHMELKNGFNRLIKSTLNQLEYENITLEMLMLNKFGWLSVQNDTLSAYNAKITTPQMLIENRI